MMVNPQGQIVLDPAEMTLCAKALDRLTSELESEADVALMLQVSTLSCALRAQALADSYEFYLSPEDQSAAQVWANTLTKGIRDEQH